MSTINIKKYYSTKRKRDLVTGSAIALFGILIVFQDRVTVICADRQRTFRQRLFEIFQM